MKVKNKTIAKLYLAGCAKITAINIEAGDAFRTIRFRREIARAFQALSEDERALATECELKLDEKGSLTGSKAALKKFREMRDILAEQESELDIQPISFDAWHELKKENNNLGNSEIEDALSDIFWLEPQKKNEKC